jgi:hypothetical protein
MMRFYSLATLLAATSVLHAQQVVFSEDFEGAQPAFTLNTPDMGSVVAGDNTWLVNNAYSGGQGTLTCLGIPFSYSIPATAAQPAGISSPNGKYLHIASEAGISSGILNCNFAAADGICTNAATHFVRMSSDVSTLGATDATLSFWWMCEGGADSYGELYFSTDGGTSWTLVPPAGGTYSNQSSWIQQTVTLPAFAGQNALRFGFRFVNNETTAANDPAFAIDDIAIATTAQTVNLSTGALPSANYCPGSTVIVPYTATGTWDTDNIFTAELSDVNGSFGAPTAIGSITSNTSGSIASVIPPGTPVGSGYLIRVTGSSPATVSDNTQAIALVEAPYAGEDHHITYCSNAGPQVLLNEFPGASTCGTWAGPDNNAMSGILDPATAAAGGYTYTTNCPGDCPQDQAVLVVGIVMSPDAGTDADLTVCSTAAPVDLLSALGGSPDAGGTWTFNSAPVMGFFNPATDSAGCFAYTVVGISPCANDTALVCVQVEDCSGIDEQMAAWPGLHWLGQRGHSQQIFTGTGMPDQVLVLDAVGRIVPASAHMEGELLTLDLAGIAAGVYAVRLEKGSRAGTVRFIQQL